jgi:hypothetical protein
MSENPYGNRRKPFNADTEQTAKQRNISARHVTQDSTFSPFMEEKVAGMIATLKTRNLPGPMAYTMRI